MKNKTKIVEFYMSVILLTIIILSSSLAIYLVFKTMFDSIFWHQSLENFLVNSTGELMIDLWFLFKVILVAEIVFLVYIFVKYNKKQREFNKFLYNKLGKKGYTIKNGKLRDSKN